MSNAALRLIPEPPARPRLKRIRLADLFCGGGGFTTGAVRAFAQLGFQMELMGVNHNPIAIATYRRNHPEATTHCQDVALLRPREAVPKGILDLLLGSPTCVYYSSARGGLPTSDQERQDPWLLIQWLTELRVKRGLFENVKEIIGWGPIDPRNGRPMKTRKGEYFNAWVGAIRACGYRVEWRILNSADFGAATSRERFFMQVAWGDLPIRWPTPTHSRVPGGLPGIGITRRWRGAREIIDWSIRGQSIFTRKRPLALPSLARILAGALKHNWPHPLIEKIDRHLQAHPKLPYVSAPTRHAGESEKKFNRRTALWKTLQKLFADSAQRTSAANSECEAEPFILTPASGGVARRTSEPLPTIIAGTGGIAHALIAPYYGGGSGTSCTSTEEPLPTATTKDRFGVVTPIGPQHAFFVAQFGEREGQTPRTHSVDAPMPTLCARGRVQLAQAEEWDVLYRILRPHELARAMGFSDAETEYSFEGTKEQVIRQIGNAVEVHTAQALITAIYARVS